MATPPKKTMFNYFTKLPSKTCIVEKNSRKSAPAFNRHHVEEFQTRVEQFDVELSSITSNSDYISLIRSSEHKPFKLVKKPRGELRARLLQFHEDIRPPYFGTWQKTSALVTGRRPHGLDNEIFDYDNDSEAEWDIGGPGESLKGDDDEEDDDELDDYEIDMETFVPHGYVSDDEFNVHSDNEDNQPANQSIDEDCDPENDSNSDVKIISEMKISRREIEQQQQQQQQQQPPPPKQTPKMDIKPITLGLNFEENPTISESKLQFLKAFQGVSCG